MKFTKTAGVVATLALAGLATGTAAVQAAELPAGAAQHHPAHGLGLDLRASRAHHAAAHVAEPSALAAAPTSYDLSQYALSPGDQGQVGSCVTWATGYTGYGILMHEQGIQGAPMAPMFIYAQIAKGNDQGTYAGVALPMEQKQGIDTRSDYTQGDFDYTTQPNSRERANAAHYKLGSFTELPTSGTSARTAIKNAISQGHPVPIGFEVHQSFMDLDSSTAADYSYLPGDDRSDPVVGGHEVTIVGYTAQGVKIENSWGTSWGARGFVTVPWEFFDTGDVTEAHSMNTIAQS
ncbi:C1 family peptidase [Amycolatopsis sp. cmx-4-83]|uniref:C1 family peptidase n=1 Tax=Amycolatopsis sp. cmx-4-83 TaxID=2790940 RepID=UPI0039784813